MHELADMPLSEAEVIYISHLTLCMQRLQVKLYINGLSIVQLQP
jgi:hypothetical protein